MIHVIYCVLLIILHGAVSKGVARNPNMYYDVRQIRDVEEVKELWLELTDENSTAVHKEKPEFQKRTLSFDFPAFGETFHSMQITVTELKFTKQNEYRVWIDPFTAPIDYNASSIRCFDNGLRFTVTWVVKVRGIPFGAYFTFQTTLYRTGDVAFVYKRVSSSYNILSGFVDYFNRNTYSLNRTVDLTDVTISNWTAIYLKPRLTCLNHKDCHSCLTNSSTSHMNCSWCPAENYCDNYYSCGNGDQSCPSVSTATPEETKPATIQAVTTTTTRTTPKATKQTTIQAATTTTTRTTPKATKQTTIQAATTTTTRTTQEETKQTTMQVATLSPTTADTNYSITVENIAIIGVMIFISLIIFLVIYKLRRKRPAAHLSKLETADIPHTTDATDTPHTIGTSQTTDKPNTTDTTQTVLITQRKEITVTFNIESKSTSGDGDFSIIPTVQIENKKIETSIAELASGETATSDYDMPRDDRWEFPRRSLTFGPTLGEGEFGKVVLAEARGILKTDAITTVAVKMLKEDHLDAHMIALVSEAEVMKMIGKHDNILNLLGVCSQNGPLYVIVEFAQHNNLKDFLIKHRPSPEYNNVGPSNSSRVLLTEEDLVSFAYQVANGMQYLHSRKCLHRDLAARNVLVTDDFTMKISDFGLARKVQVKDYIASSQGVLPYKWLAPESLSHNLFKYESDIWSYGVLIWEILTFAKAPYPSIQDWDSMVSFLRSGRRLKKPSRCPDEIYDLMQECWKYEARDRPQFSQLVSKLKKHVI